MESMSFTGETIRIDVSMIGTSVKVVSIDLLSGTPDLISDTNWDTAPNAKSAYAHICDAYTFVGFDPVEES
jgi:hypothetical protein